MADQPAGRSRSVCFLLPILSFLSRRNAKGSASAENVGINSPGNFDHFMIDNSVDNNDVSKVTRSTQSDSESASSVRSIEEDGRSSTDQLKITDLPLLPLLMICGFLRGKGCYDHYWELKRFKDTCRFFAQVVTIFMEDSKNWPSIFQLTLAFTDNFVQLRIEMRSPISLHPISQNIDFKWGFENDYVASFDIGIAGMIDQLAKIFDFRILHLVVRIYSGTTDNVQRICQNIQFKTIRIDVLTVTDEIGRLIIDLSRKQSRKLEFFIDSYGSQLTDPNAWLEQLDAFAKDVTICNHAHGRTPLGLPKSFWLPQFMKRYRPQGFPTIYLYDWNVDPLTQNGYQNWTARPFDPQFGLIPAEFNMVLYHIEADWIL